MTVDSRRPHLEVILERDHHSPFIGGKLDAAYVGMEILTNIAEIGVDGSIEPNGHLSRNT